MIWYSGIKGQRDKVRSKGSHQMGSLDISEHKRTDLIAKEVQVKRKWEKEQDEVEVKEKAKKYVEK